MRALRVIGLSIRDFYEEMFLFVPLSLVWWLPALLLIPLAGLVPTNPVWGVPVGVSLFLILVSPGSAGLAHLGYRIAHERRVDSGFFKDAVREMWWPSVRVGALNAVVLITMVVNLYFYAQFNSWIRLISILWIYGLILWAVGQLYLFPLLFEQNEPRVLLVFRNAVILVLAQPLFSLVVFIGALVLTVICTIIPVLLVLIWPGLMALIGSRAVADILEEARAQAAQARGEGDEEE